MESFTVWLLVSVFSHIASCFQGSSTLQDESVLCSFLWLSSIPLYGYPHVLFIHSIVDGWILLSNSDWRLGFGRNYFCQCRVIFLLETLLFAAEQFIWCLHFGGRCGENVVLDRGILTLLFWFDLFFPWSSMCSDGFSRGGSGVWRAARTWFNPASFTYQPCDAGQSPMVLLKPKTFVLWLRPPVSRETLLQQGPLFYKCGNWGLERACDLPRVSQVQEALGMQPQPQPKLGWAPLLVGLGNSCEQPLPCPSWSPFFDHSPQRSHCLLLWSLLSSPPGVTHPVVCSFVALSQMGSCHHIQRHLPESVVLTWGKFCTPGDVWQCLGTFLVVTTGVRGCYWFWVGRDQGSCSTCPPPQQGMMDSKCR